jgi:hypothetical protein
MSIARTIRENLEGAALIAFSFVTPFLRPLRARWGATAEERQRQLPGDDCIPLPRWEYTHAITINAPADEVWRWVVQIGQGRGGFYSYEGLENLVGCEIYNADHIMPEYQNLKVGDEIKLHPNAPALPVGAVEPGRYLLIGDKGEISSPNNLQVKATWLFQVDERPEGGARLVTRWRSDYAPTLMNRLWMGPLFIEPISFVMERKMLLGIKQRAEANWTASRSWAI